MKHHASYELHIKMALAQCALGRFANCGKSFGQKVVQRFGAFSATINPSTGQTSLKFGRIGL